MPPIFDGLPLNEFVILEESFFESSTSLDTQKDSY
jgi:hypothetical protein